MMVENDGMTQLPV